MGQPVKIVDLAERMIRLSGLQPGHDIEIVFTGMRPGERLNEILFANEEPPVEIGVAGVMAAKPNEPPMQTLRKWIAALEQAIEQRRSGDHQGRAEGCRAGVRLDRRVMPARTMPEASMQQAAKIVVVSQHYPPDPSTTAAIMAEIADHLAPASGAGAFGDAGLGDTGACRSEPA